METLKVLLDSLNMDILDLQVDFHRMSTRAENGATVEEWAQIATLGITFDRLKQHRQQLIETIAGLELTIQAAMARQIQN